MLKVIFYNFIISLQGTVHIFAVLNSGLNRRSALQKLGGVITPYTESQWGVTSFTIPAEMACVCSFLPDQKYVGLMYVTPLLYM